MRRLPACLLFLALIACTASPPPPMAPAAPPPPLLPPLPPPAPVPNRIEPIETPAPPPEPLASTGLPLWAQGLPERPTTALLSSLEIFCGFTEFSEPHAFVQFYVVEQGKIAFYNTLTNCSDFSVEFPAQVARNTDNLFGEHLLFYGIPAKGVRRENGRYYRVQQAKRTRGFYMAPLNAYDRMDSLGVNIHPDEILSQCRLLKNVTQRDICLGYQAAFQNNSALCRDITPASRSTCEAWLGTLNANHTPPT